jgi:16S rRNA A1518/A1519 N6-dimethyltransferase RsmA/KsgA/DIM1 with predicted DNA glycosylase/AP lyase activity
MSDTTQLNDQINGQDTWQYISDHFLHVCQDRSVVEIGPYDGWISEHIVTHNPRSLTLIEAREQSVDALRANPKLKSCKILLGDMHYDLNQVGPTDVAIVMGVIYHSHAPLLLLEELVNCCDPQTIILDNPAKVFRWTPEQVNSSGMRHVTGNRKTCGIVITMSEDMILTAMNHLGYRLHEKHVLPDTLSLKKSISAYHFERNNE